MLEIGLILPRQKQLLVGRHQNPNWKIFSTTEELQSERLVVLWLLLLFLGWLAVLLLLAPALPSLKSSTHHDIDNDVVKRLVDYGGEVDENDAITIVVEHGIGALLLLLWLMMTMLWRPLVVQWLLLLPT